MQIEKRSFKKYLKKHHQALDKPIQDPVQFLFSITSSCLLNEMRYYENDDERRQTILGALQLVQQTDPQFIPQLVLYLRRELGIRTTSNFILGFIACSQLLNKYLETYFDLCTMLPSDLIEVCQFTQIIYLLKQGKDMDVIKEDNSKDKFEIRKKVYLPNQLKKVLIPKILGFSEYQLGKYCSQSSRKATIQKYLAARKGMSRRAMLGAHNIRPHIKNYDLQFPDLNKVIPTSKKIRRFDNDITKVVKQVKKFRIVRGRFVGERHKPKQVNPMEIRKTAIEKTFLTMKDLIKLLHIKPTMLTSSILGAKYPQTKQEFQKIYGEGGFDESKAGKRMKLKTPQTWQTQLSEKGNTTDVWQSLISNNKLPYLASIRNLKNIFNVAVSIDHIKKVANFISSPIQVHKNRTTPLQYFSAISQVNKLIDENECDQDEFYSFRRISRSNAMKQSKKLQTIQEMEAIEAATILKIALKNALITSMDNIDIVKGTTAIFVDVSGSMRSQISGGKSFGSIRTCYQLSILLGLMITQKCQDSYYYIFSSPIQKGADCFIKMNEFLLGDLLQDMKTCKQKANLLGGGTDFPSKIIQKYIETQTFVDNMIILSDMMISTTANDGFGFIDYIAKYRNEVNSNLKVFSVDLHGYANANSLMMDFKEKNFIRIYGATTSILKFISARENNQVGYIKDYAMKTLMKNQNQEIPQTYTTQ